MDPIEYDKCFSAAFIQLNFTNVLVAVVVLMRLGFKGSLRWLYYRAILDILIQIPMFINCGKIGSPQTVEIFWKVFDFSKLVFFPMTTVYTISLIADRSQLGKYKTGMIVFTYIVWGALWLTGLTLESACTLGGNCKGPMQAAAQNSTPRQIMGAAYLVVFFLDTIFAALSVYDYFDWSKMEVNGMAIVKTFVSNRLFRVFALNAVSLIYYSINTAGGFATTTNIAGAHSYRLLDTYTNVNVTLYIVEFLIAKIELMSVAGQSGTQTGSKFSSVDHMSHVRTDLNRSTAGGMPKLPSEVFTGHGAV
ncbi:hypothetical protein HDV05_006275 [Chytridiales sp. JEL 0842]|nr:hypothetical protein HDV05_006275 [Chytridiales sp. JEL 0842]